VHLGCSATAITPSVFTACMDEANASPTTTNIGSAAANTTHGDERKNISMWNNRWKTYFKEARRRKTKDVNVNQSISKFKTKNAVGSS
jgi:hypothetical protein